MMNCTCSCANTTGTFALQVDLSAVAPSFTAISPTPDFQKQIEEIRGTFQIFSPDGTYTIPGVSHGASAKTTGSPPSLPKQTSGLSSRQVQLSFLPPRATSTPLHATAGLVQTCAHLSPSSATSIQLRTVCGGLP